MPRTSNNNDKKVGIKTDDIINKIFEQDQWEKKHPILNKLDDVWRFFRYKIPDFIRLIPFKLRERYKLNTTRIMYQDLWDLHIYLAKHIKTALIEFKKNNISYPVYMTEEEYDKQIDTIIEGCEQYLSFDNKYDTEIFELRKKLKNEEITEYDYEEQLDKILDAKEAERQEALAKMRKLFDDNFFSHLWI
jgi:hypothetical protein